MAQTRATETEAPRNASAQDIKAAQAAKDKLKKDKKTANKDKNPTQLKARSIADSSQYARFGCLVTLLAFGLGYNPMIFERVISQVTSRGIGGSLKTDDEGDDDDDSDANGREKAAAAPS